VIGDCLPKGFQRVMDSVDRWLSLRAVSFRYFDVGYRKCRASYRDDWMLKALKMNFGLV
jgi:hypothetical protein